MVVDFIRFCLGTKDDSEFQDSEIQYGHKDTPN